MPPRPLATRWRPLAVACMLGAALACSGEPAPTGETGGEAPVAAEDPAFEGDPLLAEARKRVEGGRLPDEVRARLLASGDPAHARARRILGVMDRQARGEPEPAPREEANSGADTPSTAPTLRPPEEGAPPVPENEQTTGGGTQSDEGGDDPAPTKARLAVLTRLTLKQKGKQATLTVHAASSVRVGVATQASGKVRLLVESAGALPAVLQARPSIDGLAVSDVRRGRDTVQIAVDLDEGWKVGRPTSFSGGARMTFSRS